MKNNTTQFSIILSFAVLAVSLSGCGKNIVSTTQTNTDAQDAANEINSEEINYAQEFENFLKEHGEEIVLEKVDTANWQTYTDGQRGFSFRYPGDWVVREVPYIAPRRYKDCYEALGNTGGCNDYNLKALVHAGKFLCLSPQDKQYECFIIFEELTPKVEQVSSVWEMRYRQSIPHYLNKIERNDNLDLQYIKISDRILWIGIFRIKNGRMIRTNLWWQGMKEKSENSKIRSGIVQSFTFQE